MTIRAIDNAGANVLAARPNGAALDDLDFYWGDVYGFAFSRGKWGAWADNGSRTLPAGGPGGLRRLIEADSGARPARPGAGAGEC